MKLQCGPPGAQSWAEVLREFQKFDMALTPIRDGIKAVVERARAQVREASVGGRCCATSCRSEIAL